MTFDFNFFQKPNHSQQKDILLNENYKILNIQIPRLKKYFGISQVDMRWAQRKKSSELF